MTQRLGFVLIWSLSFVGPLPSAELTAVVNPRSAALSVLDGPSTCLTIGYYDWGPQWSEVRRDLSVTEQLDAAKFTFENTVTGTDDRYRVVGAWSSVDSRTVRLQANLQATGDLDLTMAQFGFKPGAIFAGGELIATTRTGATQTWRLPLGREPFKDAVVEIEVKHPDRDGFRLKFDRPTSINLDGEVRMVLSAGPVKRGTDVALGCVLELPADTRFVAGPNRAGGVDDMDGWFPFAPPDPIPADSEWAMTDWIEAPAGKHGRIRRDGDRLIVNGQPIKLWGINNTFAACAPDRKLADRRAAFYAAMGINSVRLHKYADGTGWAGILSRESAAKFDPRGLERMDYFVAALKRRGIYTKLSPVFIIDIGPGDRDRVPFMDEFGPLRNHRVNPKHGSLYLSHELQDLLIDQVTGLLRHRNPHTGLTYAEDPAIAFVELYNEDSALFGGVSNVMAKSPTLRARGGKLFATWLKEKYGSESEFVRAWGKQALNHALVRNQKLPLDESWAENRIYPAGNPWFFDPTQLNGSQKDARRRLLDTMAFLHDLQNQVYARYTNAIRETGYDGELIASNWQAGRMMSHFYNLHSDAQIGTVDRHNYFGGGRGAGSFRNASMLSVPGSGSLSSSLQQVADRPFMLSEWIHVFPNEWGVEGPAIIGTYGMGLQGWDVSYAFQNKDDATFSKVLGASRWDVTAPQFLGVFPAVSRQVLRGDVRESSLVHHRNVNIDALDDQQVGFDEFVNQAWDEKSFDSNVFPVEALAVARGLVRFTDSPMPTDTIDLERHRRRGRLVASTNQLAWTPGESAHDGHIAINTPGTQAVVGFAENKTYSLSDVGIRLRSRFGAVYASARSRAGTLAHDDAILVTAIARARNRAMVLLNDSYLLRSGDSPTRRGEVGGLVLMEPVVAELKLKRDGLPTVHVLDHGGAKTGRTVPIVEGELTIDTARDQTPYYLIEY